MNVKARIVGVGEPVKLVVGGVHGKEGRITSIAAKMLPVSDLKGTLFIIPQLSGGDTYVSTLKRKYYLTDNGKFLINLISRIRPKIYVELHAYRKKALDKLVDPNRLKKYGVPPFYKFPDGVLLGSVSHHLLSMVNVDVALALEIPMRKSIAKGSRILTEVFRSICEAGDSDDLWNKLLCLDDDPYYKLYIDRVKSWMKKFDI